MELGAGSAGYKVASLGLPSADIDPTDPNTVFTFRGLEKDLFGYDKIHMAVYIAADISDEDFEDVKSTPRNKIPEYMLELEFMLGPDKPLTSARHGEKGISKKTLLSNELRGGD
ncbi:hypothetical protein WN943_023213 [Citrus x changshan-huyou]